MPSKDHQRSEASLKLPDYSYKQNSSRSSHSTASQRRASSLPGPSSSDQHWQRHGTQKLEEKSSSRHRSSHHKRRKSRVGPDMIDRLDNIGGISYHHDGPYDATYRANNLSTRHGPVYALKHSNEEALRATPRDMVIDSIKGRRPLDGVAFFPPGTTDRDGQKYDYKEEYGMTTEDPGDYKPWPSTVSLSLM